MAEPWDHQKRAHVSKRILKESKRIAANLGATGGVIIIAFFKDGDKLHVQDGGHALMSFKDIYLKMASCHEVMESSKDGKDVQVS